MNSYVGPILICSISKEKLYKDKEKEILTCVNQHCKFNNKDVAEFTRGLSIKPEFCIKCGFALEKSVVSYKLPRFYAYDILEQIDEVFYPVDEDCLLNSSNLEAKDDSQIDILYVRSGKVDSLERNMLYCSNDKPAIDILLDGQLHFEQEVFEKFFEKEIALVKTYYDEVKICTAILAM